MDYGGGGGAKGMLAPSPKLFGGGGLAPLAPLFLRLCFIVDFIVSALTIDCKCVRAE